MNTELTKEEKFVRDELSKVYPQLQKNMHKVCGDNHWRWGDDLLAVSVTFFLEKPLSAQLKTIENNKLENFITWIANMQLKSSSSYFYSRYRKPSINTRELYEDYTYRVKKDTSKEEVLVCIEEELKKIPEPYKELILSITYKEKTMSDGMKETGLGATSFKKTINKYLTQIEKRCQHCI
jgi:hypothetical protein